MTVSFAEPASPSAAAESSSSNNSGGTKAGNFAIEVDRVAENPEDYTRLLTLQRSMRRASANTDWDALSRQIQDTVGWQ